MVAIVRRPVPCAQSLQALSGLDPLIARLYAARQVESADDVEHVLGKLRTYHGVMGIERAVDLLEGALRSQARILVVGDFDADGATSTAVAIRALRAFGASNVDYLVPNRFEFGYGLTPEIVDLAASRAPDLIITVDNGISSLDGVRRAHSLGIQVLVTDHHLPGSALPDADAIVNPNQHGDNSALGTLAGVGVIFYVMLALRARLREHAWFEDLPDPNLAALLDLVAVGTVADVAPLDANNRILVAQGLERLRRGQGSPGVRALLRVARRDAQFATAGDLAFAVGPRLNAAGRLTDMSTGIECLLCDDPPEAFRWAERLEALNQERRSLEAEMTREAEAQVETLALEQAALPAGLCLFDESWHPGIVGIIASRVKDQTHRPVIAFARDGAEQLKGSGRSIGPLHIRDAIERVAGLLPGTVERFGGHAMAAGLTLSRSALPAFSEAFAAHVSQSVPREALDRVWVTDGELTPAQLTLSVARALREAGPWGQGFPEPLFDGVFDVEDKRTVGGKHTRLVVRPAGMEAAQSPTVEAIAFNTDTSIFGPDPMHLIYRLDVNRFRGVERLQLVVEHVQVAAAQRL